MKVSDIKVNRRIRRDLGDLSDLCESIERVGLLHPVVVTPDGELIAGVRRLAALKKLNRETVPTRIVSSLDDAVKLLIAERDENTCRKDFTPTEAVSIGEKLERLERPKAKERQGKRTDKLEGKLPSSSRRPEERTRDRVAPAVGMSPRTYEKAKAVVEKAKEKPGQFADLAELMDREGNVDKAYRTMRSRERDALPSPKLPKGQWSILYADPPWRYEHSVSESRAIENQYPTMSLDEICALKVSSISATDAVLFLWATSPKLEEAIMVINAWEFKYRTCMVWVKDKIGMGYYVRQKHELLLIATKGETMVPSEKNRPESAIIAGRRRHSEKPDVFRKLIDSMYPKIKEKCELFWRPSESQPKPPSGWHAWGK